MGSDLSPPTATLGTRGRITPMEDDEAERIFDEFAEAYRDWWGPLIAPAALQVLDDVEVPPGDPSTSYMLAVGRGTVVVSVAALERGRGIKVVGLDASSHMLEI